VFGLYTSNTLGFGVFNFTDSRQDLTISNDGNVGIGTTSPVRALHVLKADTGNALTTEAAINITNSNSAAFGRTMGVNFSVGAGAASEVFAGIYGAYTNYSTSVGGDILFATNNGSSSLAEKMRIQSNGNVGIGTTSPGVKLDVVGVIASRFSTYVYSTIDGTTDGNLYITANAGAANTTASNILFRSSTSGGAITERARIDSTGSLFVNATSGNGRLTVRGSGTGTTYSFEAANSSGNTRFIVADNGESSFYDSSSTLSARVTSGGNTLIGAQNGWVSSRLQAGTSSASAPAAEFNGTGSTSGLAPVYIWNNAESGDPYFIQFYDRGNSLARRNLGYINYKTGPGQLQLVTASDYRIKRVIGTYDKSGSVFDKIHVHEGHIYDSPMAVPFVLAHELQEAVPYAVDGEKDAVNEDGTDKLQMVGYASLIPLMLAEIKSLRARVAALES
jgi:hypothetical protein